MWGDLVLLPSLLNGMLGDILVQQKQTAEAAALAELAARSANRPVTTPVVMDVDVKPFVAIDTHPPAIVAVRPPHFQVRYSPNTSVRE